MGCVRVSSKLDGLADVFGSLIHASARNDKIARARHQSFIASHIIGGLLALCAFLIYFALLGRPTTLLAVAFIWFLSPIATSLFLSQTGRLGAAHLISAANLTGLVTFAAAINGGLSSFLLPWMIVVPLEAALSANRKVVLSAIVITCVGLTMLALGSSADLLPPPLTFSKNPIVLAAAGSFSAILYAGGLAITVQIIHRQSEAVIRQGERRYRLLAKNATDLITRHDSDGRVTFASPAGLRITGQPAEALLGDGFFKQIYAADRQSYREALERSLGEGILTPVEFRLRSSGGEDDDNACYVWAEMRFRPVDLEITSGTGARELVAVTREIAERKAQELALLKARDEAESASRAKTRFLANMSHELRTPLIAIIGFSDILNRQLFGPIGEERYRDYARLILESGEHLLGVVNGILDMSKIEAGKFDIVTEPFNIETLIASCTELMHHTAEQKSIDLIAETAPGLPEIVADKRVCKQILINLLSNAIKFTGEGGWVKIAAKSDGNMLELSVADNGIGIASSDLPNLGDPFVQAENSHARNYEGTGLGLSLVKNLAQLHGGNTEIDSESGLGTTVTILLPLKCETAEHIESPKGGCFRLVADA